MTNLGSYISVFVLGFAGSLHCIGMCGPLQMFLTKTQWPFKFMYHYGRYIAYALIGIVFYMLGYTAQILSLQKYLTILAGIFIIVSVVFPFFTQKFSLSFFTSHMYLKAKNQSSYVKFFIMGFANGLLPCGLVYVGASHSILAYNFWQALLMMLLFLLGTLPALFSLNYVYEWMGKGRFYIEKLRPAMMLAMGILLIYRGVYAHEHKQAHKTASCVSVK